MPVSGGSTVFNNSIVEYSYNNNVISRWGIEQLGIFFVSTFLVIPMKVAWDHTHISHGKSLASDPCKL